jgi:penicillin-binding protein 2
MLIFDQLRKSDRPLQMLAGIILAGIVILFCGLWYVQVISAQRYRNDLQNQSFRSVRVPAIRGKILDRNGVPLADNRPSYNVNLYLEELRGNFQREYTNRVLREFAAANRGHAGTTPQIRAELGREARYRVASNLLYKVSAVIDEPQILNSNRFHRHYEEQRSLPFPLLKDIPPRQVASFVEQSGLFTSLELDVQPMRYYPNRNAAAHLMGIVKLEAKPEEDEDIPFRFYLPDYTGKNGIEASFDTELRGQAGAKSVLVNSLAYRQREEMIMEPRPGRNVTLTIDLAVQQAAERGLAATAGGTNTRGAAVAIDVHSGDVLAFASSPAFDPNEFVTGITPEELERLNDKKLSPMFNRAAYGEYPAGSTFKIIVALAALEAGRLNPDEIYTSLGYIMVGKRKFHDTAGPGDFDFDKAFYKSSNPYFIKHGIALGAERIIEMGRRFHLGEPTGLTPRREAPGYFPSGSPLRKQNGDHWTDGDTANLSIGHGEIEITPLQMACMVAAVANGGKLPQPRIVASIESPDSPGPGNVTVFPAGVVRAQINVSQRTLDIVHKAMLADVENPAGSGKNAFVSSDFRVCGKTGTATLPNDRITWFVSYAPYENPRYAVVVVVSGGAFGGTTCAPVAREIYRAIVKTEQAGKLEARSVASHF